VSSQSAVAAAVATAGGLGLRSTDPVVLRDAWHVLVHLRPLPLVARVSSSVPFPEGPKPDDVVRELAVARHAARAGAPVIPPADDVGAGPHRHGAHVVTLWRYVGPGRDPDASAAGRGLRAIHDALLDFEGDLPDGHAEETVEMLAGAGGSPDVDLLRELVARDPGGNRQALHGDAHLGNCLRSNGETLWHDFETACRGAREYDLAALVLRDRTHGGDVAARAALGAYGNHDGELVEELVPVYAAWIYASFLLALPRRPGLAAVLEERLAWLRRYTTAQ
jgi:hypothetical protein